MYVLGSAKKLEFSREREEQSERSEFAHCQLVRNILRWIKSLRDR
jgi:hypothetical protein